MWEEVNLWSWDVKKKKAITGREVPLVVSSELREGYTSLWMVTGSLYLKVCDKVLDERNCDAIVCVYIFAAVCIVAAEFYLPFA